MEDLIKYRTKVSSLFACFGKESKSRRKTKRNLHRKMVIVGDGACGKTCLVTRMTRGQFVDIGYIPTVFDTEVVNVSIDDQDVELGIFDTAGQEEYDRLRPLSYHEVDVALICFSLEDQDSLTNVEEHWSPEIRHYCGRVPVILVGNKLDLRDRSVHSSGQTQDIMHDTQKIDEETGTSPTGTLDMKAEPSLVDEDIEKRQGDDDSIASVGSKTSTVSALFTDDLCSDRQAEKATYVSRSQGVSVAKRIGAIAYFETSALTGSNVSELLTATASAAMLGNKKAKKCKSLAKTLNGREPMLSLPQG